MNTHLARAVAATFVAAGTIGIPAQVLAAGFALPEVSTAGIATANAMVANPEAVGAIPYNAAAMGFQGSSAALGAIMIGPTFSVTTAAGRFDSTGAEWIAGPMIQGAFKVNDQWRIGFGINAPFGLETRWPYGTFPALAGTTPLRTPAGTLSLPKGNHPTSTMLQVVDFVPSVAFRVNDSLSVGAGIDIYWAKSAELNSNLGQMNGDGTGVGFDLGLLYRYKALTFGVSWHSTANVDLTGDYAPLNSTLIALRQLPPAQGASLNVNLPWRVQVGLRYAFTPTVAAEFDWTYTGWNSFRELTVIGDMTGAVITSDTEDWSDASAYRLGLTWRVRPTTELRCGYAYDETGQGTNHFSARVPDNDRQLFSLGLAQDLGRGFSVEASYMYVLANERNIRSAVPYRLGAEVNGTSAFNGNYEMHANVVGIEVIKTF
jgi:long-chain fatty acid transport protein